MPLYSLPPSLNQSVIDNGRNVWQMAMLIILVLRDLGCARKMTVNFHAAAAIRRQETSQINERVNCWSVIKFVDSTHNQCERITQSQ